MSKGRDWDLLRRRRAGSQQDLPVLGSSPGPGKVINARYNTTCLVCHGRIKKGSPVMWRKGVGTWHLIEDCE